MPPPAAANLSAPSTRRQLPRILWLLLLAGVLLAPATHLALAPLEKGWALERRRLRTTIDAPPRWNSTRSLRAQTDAFLRDQFILRRWLIEKRIRIAIAANVSPSQRVILGRDGWLFVNSNRKLDDLRGRGRLDDTKAAVLAARLSRLVRTLEAKGIRVVLTIAPDKASIYPQYLPRWIKPVSDEEMNYARFRRQMKNFPNLERRFVDLKAPLQRAAARDLIYSYDDTHWNARGAFEAYLLIAGQMAKQRRDFRPIPRSEMRFVAGKFVGGLARTIGPNAAKTVRRNMRGVRTKPAPAFAPPQREKLPYPGWSTTIFMRRVSSPSAAPKTLLIIGDSFSGGLIPYFQHDFDRIVWTHHLFGAWSRSLIDRFQPDTVIIEMVERFLANYVRNP